LTADSEPTGSRLGPMLDKFLLSKSLALGNRSRERKPRHKLFSLNNLRHKQPSAGLSRGREDHAPLAETRPSTARVYRQKNRQTLLNRKIRPNSHNRLSGRLCLI